MSFLANLTGQSVNAVLSNTTISIAIDDGASCDYTVRQGVIGGMSNGAALIGSGGHITPSTFDETLQTHTSDAQTPGAGDSVGSEAKEVNVVRFDGNALKVAHSNGDTVLYICVITSAGDIVGKLVS